MSRTVSGVNTPSSKHFVLVLIQLFLLFAGIIAIIFSVLSSSAADEGDMEAAKVKGKISLAISLIGMLITILSIVIVIVYIVVLAKKTVDTYDNAYSL